VTSTRRAYSSTVASPLLLAGGAVLAGGTAAAIAALVPAGPAGVAGVAGSVVAGLVLLAADAYSATVRVAVGSGTVRLGQGPLPRPVRTLDVGYVTDARAVQLGWAEVFGLGVPWNRRTTRMTVRPGPTLVLELADGEVIRVSTPDPQAVVDLLAPASDPPATIAHVPPRQEVP
jgi:hypothetical protein